MSGIKYYVVPFFTSETIDTANTAATSTSFDIGEISRLWIQHTGWTAGDVHAQLQVSNDALEKADVLSHWEAEGSPFGVSSADPGFDKHTALGAQKCRLVLTRQSGAMTLTVRGIAKPI